MKLQWPPIAVETYQIPIVVLTVSEIGKWRQHDRKKKENG